LQSPAALKQARRATKNCGTRHRHRHRHRAPGRRAGSAASPRVPLAIAGDQSLARGKLSAVATLASYGLAILGFIMMATAVARTLASNLKYMYTRPLLINALRTNANHAEQLCKTSPDSYFGAIGAAIKTAALIGSRDPKILVTATAPAYDATGMTVSMKWKQLVGRVKLALMAAGGALMVGMSTGVPPILVMVLSASVGIGFLWLYFYKAEVDSCIIRARAEILPEVDRAFADGRYVFPPAPPK
jgi:hypothetical protein